MKVEELIGVISGDLVSAEVSNQSYEECSQCADCDCVDCPD